MSAAVAAQFSQHPVTSSPERGFLVALLRDVKLAARSKGEVIQALVLAKQGSDLTTSALAQAAACEIMRDRVEESYLPDVLAAYRLRRDALCAAAEEHIAAHFAWDVPPGGMFVWMRPSRCA